MKLPSANHVKTEDADSESVLDGRRLLEILRILCDTPDPERSSDYDEREEKTIHARSDLRIHVCDKGTTQVGRSSDKLKKQYAEPWWLIYTLRSLL